jgi:luciferase family oxidoreductase group 1
VDVLDGQLELGVLDQSPLRKGGNATDALKDTVRLAQTADRLGYSRFWVAEHHNSSTFVGTSPEILIGQILANTNQIKVGSGGVLLTHYSALHAAEQFKVLESFYPGRVEMGIGRAPGGGELTTRALTHPKLQPEENVFPDQVSDLVGFLKGTLPDTHDFASLHAQAGPPSVSAPQVWLLGSSDVSAKLASQLGLPYAYADFFGDIREKGPSIAQAYRDNFQPSALFPEPQVLLALQVMCAPTQEQADYLGASRNLHKAAFVMDAPREGLLPPGEALDFPLSEKAVEWQRKFRAGYIDGDPFTVKNEIIDVAKTYGADKVGIVTITYDIEDKIRSYALIAQAFGLATD